MAMDLSGEQIRALVAAGWTPPKVDYEAWRPALAIFYTLTSMPAVARGIDDSSRQLDPGDRATIDALAAAFEAAPKDA